MPDTTITRSDVFTEIIAALLRVQSDLGPAMKNAKNPHFNRMYADLQSIHEACSGLLIQNGLVVVQAPQSVRADWSATTTDKDGLTVTRSAALTTILETTIYHVSGQWISSSMPLLLTKPDAQGQGSAITYARRYALAALLGIIQADDDGESASSNERPRQNRQAPSGAKQQQQSHQKRQQKLDLTISTIITKAITKEFGWKLADVKQFLSEQFQMEFTKLTTSLKPEEIQRANDLVMQYAPARRQSAPAKKVDDHEPSDFGEPDDPGDQSPSDWINDEPEDKRDE